MHQDQMALARCKDQGGFNGDRIAECKLATLYAKGTDWLKVVVEKSDLSQSNLAEARIREVMIAHTALRKSRLSNARISQKLSCSWSERPNATTSMPLARTSGSAARNASTKRSAWPGLSLYVRISTSFFKAFMQRA